MKNSFPARVDHLGIFRKAGSVTAPFFRLGFVAAGGADYLVLKDGKPVPGAGALIFDNAYIELSMKPIYADPIWPKGGFTYLQFGTMDAAAAHRRLAEAGFSVGEVAVMSRYADHGENKGNASFAFFCLSGDVLPNAYYGAVQHLNRELMYQPTRYIHKNGVSRINSITVFENNAEKSTEIAKKSSRFCSCLGDAPPSGGVPVVHVMNRGEARETYGVAIPNDTRNVVGIHFHTDDLNLVKAHLDGFTVRQSDGSIVVDMMEDMNVYLVFTEE